MKTPKNYTTFETLMMLLALLVFAGTTTVYFAGISLRKHLLGWRDEVAEQKVGTLSGSDGVVRRQLRRASSFEQIDSNSPLFNQDTIVTSAGSSATLSLADGGIIELGPNTMVRLSFDSEFSIGGISRSPEIEIVEGKVTGRAKSAPIRIKSRGQVIPIAQNKPQTIEIASAPIVRPSAKAKVAPIVPIAAESTKPRPVPTPSEAKVVAIASPAPSPSPTPCPSPSVVAKQIKMVAPAPGSKLRVSQGSQSPSRTVGFEWTVTPPDATLLLTLKKINGSSEEVVLQKPIQAQAGRGAFRSTISNPGVYQWELGEPDAKSESTDPAQRLTRARFAVEKSFDAIETLAPLVGGVATDSNLYQGESSKKFDITLRWKPYPGAEDYNLLVTDQPHGKPLLEKSLSETSYNFVREKISKERIFYSVQTRLPSGFVVSSEPKPFIFNFGAPVPVLPKDNTALPGSASASGGQSVLMTWHKTNFTKSYELEIATDPNFTKKILTKKLKENFIVVKALATGRYWWRVRAYSEGVVSPYSQASSISFTE